MACHNKNTLSLFWTLTFLLTCHGHNHWKVFFILLLTRLSVTSASILEEIPNSFLFVSSLNMLSFTMLTVITPFGVQLLKDTTKVSQLSSKELNKSKVVPHHLDQASW